MTTVVINSVDLGLWGLADPGEIPNGKKDQQKRNKAALRNLFSICPANWNLYFSLQSMYTFQGLSHTFRNMPNHTLVNKQNFIFL